MHRLERTRRAACKALFAAAVWGAASGVAYAQPNATYYQCPGNVFTNTISAKEAESRKCTAREAKEPTTIAGPTRPRPAIPGSVASSPASARIDPAAQRTRDTDARRILESELTTEEERLAALQKERVAEIHHRLAAISGLRERVVLSTCNRMEIYAVAERVGVPGTA